MTLIRPGRTGFRGRRAAEADASFFEDRTGARPGAQARPSPSLISPAEEAESRVRWTHALLRQRLRGAVTRTEKIAGGIYAAALMVLLGHEWPHHREAAPDHGPAATEGNDAPDGRIMPAAAPGPAEAASLAGGEEPLLAPADDGSLDLRKFAPGTTIIPSAMFRTAGDHAAELSGNAGGGASRAGQPVQLAAVQGAGPIMAAKEAAFAIGQGPSDITSTGEVPAAARAPAQGVEPAGTSQQGQTKPAEAAPAPAPADTLQARAPSQSPAKAQDLAARAEPARSQSQDQGDHAGGAPDAASTGTIPSHAQDVALAQARAMQDMTAAITTARSEDKTQGPAKAQDSAMAGTPEGQGDDIGSGGRAQEHSQSQAKGRDIAPPTVDAIQGSDTDIGGRTQGHGQGQGQAKGWDVASAATDAAQSGGTDAGGPAQGQAKGQDVAAAADTAQGRGGNTDAAGSPQDHAQDQGPAKAQGIASAIVSTIADVIQGDGEDAVKPAQGQGHAKGQEIASAVADTALGSNTDAAEAAQDHAQGKGLAKVQDTASTAADAAHLHGPAGTPDDAISTTVTLAQDQGLAKGQAAQEATAKAATVQDNAQDLGPAKVQDTASAATGTDRGQDQGHATALAAQDAAAKTATAQAPAQDSDPEKGQGPASATADASHGRQGGRAAEVKAQDIATAGRSESHGRGHAKQQDQDAADMVLLGGDHGRSHTDHAEALLFPQAGHADTMDALAKLLTDMAGAGSVAISTSAHPLAALPQDASVHAHLHASAAQDLSPL